VIVKQQMPNIPKELESLFNSVSEQFLKLLGQNLVGIYVYGSLTQGAFDPARSDVDLVVATRRDLSDGQIERLGKWLDTQAAANEWTTRLQMMIIASREIFTMDARAVHYQFGKLRRDGSDGNPIPWINILESGITLYGPRPSEFVPEITSEMVNDTMVRELGYLSEELGKTDSEWRDMPKYRAYAVLTVCRILYTLRKDRIVSKPRAAIWALRTLPAEWHALVNAAVAHDAGQAAKLPLREIQGFVRFAQTNCKPNIVLIDPLRITKKT
jgi:predicted nucleotidyltransferase